MDEFRIVDGCNRMGERGYLQAVLNRYITHCSKRVEFLDADPRGWYLIDGDVKEYMGLMVHDAREFIMRGFYGLSGR